MLEMTSSSKPIAIASRLDKENALELVKKIIEYLTQRGTRVVLENRIAKRFHKYIGHMDLSQMTEDTVKAVISVGGDGTILRVAQNLPKKRPAPILGINLGSIGFLDEFDMQTNDLEDLLDRIIENKYVTERVMRLSTEYSRYKIPDALNEVYIVTSKASKVLHVGIRIDGEMYNTSYLDGVIISTATGSTAYCLSAGGSLIDPRLKVIQIVPVNPFAGTGSLKPIVVPGASTVEIELLRPKLNAQIIIDGQFEWKAYPKSIIKVRKSDFDVKFIRFTRDYKGLFYERLRKKLLTGVKLPIEDAPEE